MDVDEIESRLARLGPRAVAEWLAVILSDMQETESETSPSLSDSRGKYPGDYRIV